MSSIVHYTETKLTSKNKDGVLTPDENGYYTVILGALNTFNSAGEYYEAQNSVSLFQNSSSLMRRIKNGALYAELGHPKKTANMTDEEYLRRILSIDETNICAHISDVWLDLDYGKKYMPKENNNLIAIFGKIKPSGPHARVLEDDINNKKINVAFSIRALTNACYKKGVLVKTLDEVITWDRVAEPGIQIANKWDIPSLEDIVDYKFTKEQIINYTQQIINSHISTEDNKIIARDLAEKYKVKDNKFVKSLQQW